MSKELSPAEQALGDASREYHRLPTRGKISVNATKPLINQRDLALAYSPGVAYPCLDIEADPNAAAHYTARGNLVGQSRPYTRRGNQEDAALPCAYPRHVKPASQDNCSDSALYISKTSSANYNFCHLPGPPCGCHR